MTVAPIIFNSRPYRLLGVNGDGQVLRVQALADDQFYLIERDRISEDDELVMMPTEDEWEAALDFIGWKDLE